MSEITKINLKGTILDIKDADAARKSELPTKVSDLTNDLGFITASDAAGIVALSGDLAIVETSEYIDLIIQGASIGVTPSKLSLNATKKSATIKVSGSHLKGDISISVPSGFTASPSTISHVNGTVAETDVTITYTGEEATTARGNITAMSVDVGKSIPVTYTQYSVPTILTDKDTLSLYSPDGVSQDGTIVVNAVNLTDNVSLVLSGTDAGKFSLSANSISQSDGFAEATVTVSYNPQEEDAGTHTATLTLSSTGATSKTISLIGKSRIENVEYPDAYKLVYDLTEETSLTPFSQQTPTPTRVIVDGTDITPAMTFTLGAGTHTVYYFVNPWAVANSYSGQPQNAAAAYMVEYRLPRWYSADVTSNYHNIFWFNPSANLSEITCLCATPPNFGAGTNANGALRASTVKKIRVPIEALSDYQTAEYWSATAVKAKLVGVKFDFEN